MVPVWGAGVPAPDGLLRPSTETHAKPSASYKGAWRLSVVFGLRAGARLAGGAAAALAAPDGVVSAI